MAVPGLLTAMFSIHSSGGFSSKYSSPTFCVHWIFRVGKTCQQAGAGTFRMGLKYTPCWLKRLALLTPLLYTLQEKHNDSWLKKQTIHSKISCSVFFCARERVRFLWTALRAYFTNPFLEYSKKRGWGENWGLGGGRPLRQRLFVFDQKGVGKYFLYVRYSIEFVVNFCIDS